MEECKEFERRYPGSYNCLEIVNVTLDGVSVVKTIDTLSTSYSIPHEKALPIVAKQEGNHYKITYSILLGNIKKAAEYFDKYIPLANERIDSFEFIWGQDNENNGS